MRDVGWGGGGVGWDGWLVIVVAIRSCDRRPSLLRMAAMIDSRCYVLFKKCTRGDQSCRVLLSHCAHCAHLRVVPLGCWLISVVVL